jgi:hypothetical protein
MWEAPWRTETCLARRPGGAVWATDDLRHRDPDEVALHLDDVATAMLVELIRHQDGAGRPVTFVLANLFATCVGAEYGPDTNQ